MVWIEISLLFLRKKTAHSGLFSQFTIETIPEITTRKFTVDELVTLSSVFVFDHPEFFWISPSYTASSGGKNISFSLKLYDQYQDGTARETARKEIEEIEQGYINQALTYATDYDRAKYLAQALAEDITFGYGENNIDQSIASAFLDKKTVCAGYAKAYSLLCNSVGVDTITELSLVHGWNAVRIADNWYNVDVNQKLFLYSDAELSAHDENGKLYTATDENGNEFTFHMHDVYDGYYTFALPDTSQSYDGAVTYLSELSPGDIDGNGSIDILDVIMINKAIFGKTNLTEAQIKAADVNHNNKPDFEDSLAVMRYIVKLTDTLG